MKNLLETFDGWSKTAFIIAAVLIGAFAATTAAYNIMDNPIFQEMGLVVAPAAIVFAVIGTWSLHAVLWDDQQWLVGIAAVLGLIAWLGGAVATLGQLGVIAGLVAGDTMWVEGVRAVIPLGYLAVTLTGIAALRSSHYSQIAGILLLLPGILVFSSFALIGLIGESNEAFMTWVLPVYDAIFMLVLGGIGLSLPGEAPQPATQQKQQPTAA